MIGDVVEVLWFLPLMLVAIKLAAELRAHALLLHHQPQAG